MLAEPESLPKTVSIHKRNWRGERGKFQWEVFVQLSICHIGALFAPWYFTWPAFFCFVFMWIATAGLGVCVGFHRLLTHRSFETNIWIKRALTFIGTLAVQGGPSVWVGTHRLHHQHSDDIGDPHSPKENFWWGHLVWLHFFEHLEAQSFSEDVVKDPWIRWMDKLWFVSSFSFGGVLWLIGGLPFLIWGMFVRTVFVWHVTWAVNSVSHRWGYRNFDTADGSRNNRWVALLSFGEGWHNNHHAYPQSARHGLRPLEIDLAYLFICLLGKLGLAWKIKTPRESLNLEHASDN
jgi:stearoyl-CoA desaturase (delta-9 desaturase)